MKKVFQRAIAGFFMCIAVLGLTACGRPEPLKIGLLAGLSGRTADLGQSAHDGALLAIEQANQAGGIRGRRVELLVRDDGGSVNAALEGFNQLVAQKVKAVVGPMTSSMAESVLPASQSAGVLLLSPTVTGSRLAGGDDNLFMASPSTAQNSRHSADHQLALGRKRLAVLYDQQNRSFSEDWIEGFRNRFSAGGGRLEVLAGFNSGDVASYGEAVEALALQSERYDAIMYVANAVDSVQLLQQVRARGIRKPALGTTWSATEHLLELGGRDVEGMSFVQMFNRDDPSAEYQAFRSAYTSRFRQEPGFASIAAYDAARALIRAMSTMDDPEQGDIKQALLKSGPYAGVQGAWSFDPYGSVNRPVFVTVVREGRFVVEK